MFKAFFLAALVTQVLLAPASYADPITIGHSRTVGSPGCYATANSGTYTVDLENRYISTTAPSASADYSECFNK